jgi:hypothetical protein
MKQWLYSRCDYDCHRQVPFCFNYQDIEGPSWSSLYGSWFYNYLWNQCLSPLTLWVRIPLRWRVLDTTVYDKVCQWRAAWGWFSPDTPLSFTNKTDRHDIAEILLKVALSTNTLTLTQDIEKKPTYSTIPF